MNDSSHLIKEMQAAISSELESCIQILMEPSPQELTAMVRYQLGIQDTTGQKSTGKRLRPLIVLATCHSLGGRWQEALQAAAAVELMHNFSLIHDDIQDQSRLRRGKDTLWVKWGIPQAINAGDAMLVLSNLEGGRNLHAHNEKTILVVNQILNTACLQLTHGQYLDLAYETMEQVQPEDYIRMVRGKTGALLAACFALGGVIAGQPQQTIDKLINLGNEIGIAFQIQDDWLGIWGNEEQTGKPATSDLLERKKTFPVIKALGTLPVFHNYWFDHAGFSLQDVTILKEMITAAGLREEIGKEVESLYRIADDTLEGCFEDQAGRDFIRKVTSSLWHRVV